MDLTKKDFFDLDLIGAHPTEEPFVLIVQITTVGLFLRLFYFDFFLYDDERSLAVCSEAIESLVDSPNDECSLSRESKWKKWVNIGLHWKVNSDNVTWWIALNICLLKQIDWLLNLQQISIDLAKEWINFCKWMLAKAAKFSIHEVQYV